MNITNLELSRSMLQIVDTYGIRVLQNNGKKPTRLRISSSLARKLCSEYQNEILPKYTPLFSRPLPRPLPRRTVAGLHGHEHVHSPGRPSEARQSVC